MGVKGGITTIVRIMVRKPCSFSVADGRITIFCLKRSYRLFLKKGTLSHLYKAFSRSSEKKQYVQDMMKSVASELAHMICKQNASVYICGDGNNMGKQVQECIADILEKH